VSWFVFLLKFIFSLNFYFQFVHPLNEIVGRTLTNDDVKADLKVLTLLFDFGQPSDYEISSSESVLRQRVEHNDDVKRKPVLSCNILCKCEGPVILNLDRIKRIKRIRRIKMIKRIKKGLI
jgi:hypothetical protein